MVCVLLRLSVYLCVGHTTYEPCLTNWDAVWGGRLVWVEGSNTRWGPDLLQKGHFWVNVHNHWNVPALLVCLPAVQGQGVTICSDIAFCQIILFTCYIKSALLLWMNGLFYESCDVTVDWRVGEWKRQRHQISQYHSSATLSGWRSHSCSATSSMLLALGFRVWSVTLNDDTSSLLLVDGKMLDTCVILHSSSSSSSSSSSRRCSCLSDIQLCIEIVKSVVCSLSCELFL